MSTDDGNVWLAHSAAMAGAAPYGEPLEVLRAPTPPAQHRLRSSNIQHPACEPNLWGAETRFGASRGMLVFVDEPA